LLVTDRGLVDLGMPGRLPCEPTAMFAEIPTNPTEESVLACLAAYRENNCDGIIALGGGSPIDCAKCIALLTTHPEPLEQYALIRGGRSLITADIPPLIAVPTTAGTGSEVGRATLITVAAGAKLGLISPHLIPTAAVCDPQLTLGMPAPLTAATGVDAISHCVETFCSPMFNPVADAIALDGLGRAWKNLPAAVKAPNDITYRSEMMMASTQGALAFQKGLGLIHSLSHPLGALTEPRLHHGTLNAVFLPHVIRFNASACPGKIKAMGQAMGVGAEAVAEAFAELNTTLGLPARLSELGVTTAHLAGIAEAALADHSTPCNPRALELDDCQAVLDAAL
jgi:alcohol dehydrogenase class IV